MQLGRVKRTHTSQFAGTIMESELSHIFYCYKIKRDKESCIVNDPNGWFAHPRGLFAAIKYIVHVSVESTRIIKGLPSQLTEDLCQAVRPRDLVGFPLGTEQFSIS